MKDSCIIKSFPNGINLILKEDVVFDLLLEEIGNKFEKSRPFFGNASVALSFEGRELTSEEETEIVNVIHKSSDIDVVCIMAKDSKTDLTFVEALQKKDHIEYLLDVLLYEPIEERAALVRDYGKEVLNLEQRLSELSTGAERESEYDGTEPALPDDGGSQKPSGTE